MGEREVTVMDEVSDFAATAMRNFAEGLAERRTQLIRFAALEVHGENDEPTSRAREERGQEDRARDLREAVEAPDAPASLIRLGHAVRAGRTSYAEIIAGRADDLPEVSAVRDEARKGALAIVAETVSRLERRNDSPSVPGPPPTDQDSSPGGAADHEAFLQQLGWED